MVSNRRGLRLKPPHPPAKIASRMQFFCRIIFVPDYRTGIIEHAVSNRRGLRLKPPPPPAKIASRMQFF